MMEKSRLVAQLRARLASLSGSDDEPGGQKQACFSFGLPELDVHLPWKGLPRGALHEVVAASYQDLPAAFGFCAGLAVRLNAAQPGSLLWCEPQQAAVFGNAYGAGLAGYGLDPERLLFVRPRTLPDLLWALEEGVRCSALLGVIGVLPLRAEPLSLTATRRLLLAAEASGVSAFLLHTGSPPQGSAALTRWQVAAAPSAPLQGLRFSRPTQRPLKGIGSFRWQVTLSRCRGGRGGTWLVEWNQQTGRFALASPLADRPVLPRAADGWRQAG